MKFTFETEPNPYGTEMTLEIRVDPGRVSEGTLERLEELYLQGKTQLEAVIAARRNSVY